MKGIATSDTTHDAGGLTMLAYPYDTAAAIVNTLQPVLLGICDVAACMYSKASGQ